VNPEIAKDVISQLSKNMKLAVKGNKKELMVHIKPPELGKVQMKLSMENGKLTAKFAVDNEKVLQMLENNRVTLTRQLEQTGLSIENIDIELQQGGHSKENMQNFLENVKNGKSGSTGSTNIQDYTVDDAGVGEVMIQNTALPDWIASEINLTI
jgi:flagellar hook-length control protein FliK